MLAKVVIMIINQVALYLYPGTKWWCSSEYIGVQVSMFTSGFVEIGGLLPYPFPLCAQAWFL